jgi:hypothetical protein
LKQERREKSFQSSESKKVMSKTFVNKNNGASGRRIKENYVKNNQSDSLVNCDNKANHARRYESVALLSGQNRSKLSIDGESSHPINGSSTNNKSERKRNIKMLDDGDKEVNEGVGCEGDVRDSLKRLRVDGRDNNKSKMYQVSRILFFFLLFI